MNYVQVKSTSIFDNIEFVIMKSCSKLKKDFFTSQDNKLLLKFLRKAVITYVRWIINNLSIA